MTCLRISACFFGILFNYLTSVTAETSVPNFKSSGPPRLRGSAATSYEVPLGERCKFRCPVPKTSLVEWFREGDRDAPLQPPGSERVRVGRATLTILNVTYSDEGVYFCRASNSHGEVYNNFTLKVIEPYLLDEPEEEEIYREPGSNDEYPPRFTSKMNDLLARPAGSSVVLRCNSNGNPAPTIEWLKNGRTPPLREHNKEVTFKKHSLILDHLTLYDSGKYVCLVSNDLGNISHTFDLEVQERIPHRPIFRDGYPSNQTVRVGGTARFECRFVSDLQPRMVFLRHFEVNGSYSEPDSDLPYVRPLDSDPRDPHVLLLRNVTYEHAGFYTCLAGNSIGVSYRSAYLTVLPPEGEELEDDGAIAMETVHSEPRPLVLPTVLVVACLGFATLSVVVGAVICRCRYRKEKIAATLRTSMVVTKKVVLEKREQEDDTASSVPFVKIDYKMVVCPSGDPSPFPEYQLEPDPEWEFPREKLLLGRVLGEGAFGRVVKGEAAKGDAPQTVAVKMLKDNHMDSEMAVLVSEMELMKSMGKHMNIVSLQGVCSQGGPLYVIVEYCENGNLRDYLRTHRIAINATYDEGYEEPIGGRTPDFPIKTLGFKNLLSFAYQTARGMEYLATKKLVHRDLAARNLLLTDRNVIKIADFGLSRDIYDTDYYKKVSNSGRLPIKWMAPETLHQRVYSSSSDCWSYGVVLWEIFTLGATPYPTVPHERLLDKLRQGHRMAKPEQCPMEVYLLMRKCWLDVPKERPTWAEIAKTLDRIMLDSIERVYLELDFPVLSTPENSSSSEDS